MANKVLTLDEVLALADGATVWSELHPNAHVGGGEHRKYGDRVYDEGGKYWRLDGCHRKWCRFWLQPPTPDELAAWPLEKEAKDA